MNEKIIKKLIILIFLFFLKYYKIIKVHVFDNPLVSIIIPAYKKLENINKCINSIVRENSHLSYEIIIAYDILTDLKKYINISFSNIYAIKNEKEYGIVLNCNKAANLARGNYILFLDNDVQVQKGWLLNLVKLIERNDKIGMVGSKIIYQNGTLQEAGGIIWKDGIKYNYGIGKDPKMPEYNYVKEVDFISSSSILIRKSIWKQIGGFDMRYNPQYYEDIDLAFEVRRHGYKVMYQPNSVVVHLEGISNCKDLSLILKKKIINKNKFIEKWFNVLKQQCTPKNLFKARDRTYNKKRILVIDNCVPEFDKNAGYRCTYMYLKIFQSIGLVVTFIGDDFKKKNPYTSILQQEGIEVLYGNFYKSNIKKWLKNNLKNYEFVFLQRPNIALKYLDFIKKKFSGKIFYFAHDLHHIRLFREYKITRNKHILKMSQFLKKIEFDIFSKVDVGYVVGSYEQKIVKEKFKNKSIHNIPIYIYEKPLYNIEKNFFNRKDLIFVGGFGHSPNKDAILWFSKEIFPHVLEKFPEMILHIVGSKMPLKVKKLCSKNIMVYGYMTDEDLKSLYQKCRIAIAPLRFGAGVKGKIVEAAYNQIPIITTSIGVEGLDNSFGAILVENNPLKMAQLICSIYNDFEKLKKISDLEKIFIEKYFTLEKAKEIIIKDIKLKR